MSLCRVQQVLSPPPPGASARDAALWTCTTTADEPSPRHLKLRNWQAENKRIKDILGQRDAEKDTDDWMHDTRTNSGLVGLHGVRSWHRVGASTA